MRAALMPARASLGQREWLIGGSGAIGSLVGEGPRERHLCVMQSRGMSPDVDVYRNVPLSRYFVVSRVRLVTRDIALWRAVRDQIVIMTPPADPLPLRDVLPGVEPAFGFMSLGASKSSS